MRTLIVGAGALGGYFGARLLAAGRDVTFLVRPATARRLAANGLHLLSSNGDLHLPPPPTVLAEDLKERFGLILLSCKAHDLASAIDAVAPAIGSGTAILPLLNGMAHMALLDERFGREQVLGGMSRISAVRAEDGVIHHLNSLDMLVFGDRDKPDSDRMRAIATTLADAHFQAKRSAEILHQMWEKWVTIATAAGSTVLMRATVGDIVNADATWVVHALLAECAAIATAEGFAPPPAFLAQISGWFTTPGSSFTASMLRDLESGAPIEAWQILGNLLEYARRHGVETPVLRIAYAHAHCHEIRMQREAETSKE